MPNRLNKVAVIQTAADMADRNGLSSVTLKTVADELGIKSPSLYKHIPDGLDGLHRELMLYGWRSVEAVMVKAAVGKSKDDAMYAISCAFRNFVKAHTGLFEAMQWYNMYVSDEALKATEKIVDLLFQVLDGYELSERTRSIPCVLFARSGRVILLSNATTVTVTVNPLTKALISP